LQFCGESLQQFWNKLFAKKRIWPFDLWWTWLLKSQPVVPWITFKRFIKFHKYLVIRFWEILITDRQRERHRWKHNLLHWGNKKMLHYSFTRKHICLYCHFVAFIWMVYFDFKLISLAALRIRCGYLFSITKLWINQSTFHSFVRSFVRSFVHSFRSIQWMWCSDAPNFVSNLPVVTGTLQVAQNAPRPPPNQLWISTS